MASGLHLIAQHKLGSILPIGIELAVRGSHNNKLCGLQGLLFTTTCGELG